MTISIPSIAFKQINEYCSINSIDNIEDFCVKCLMKGFSIEKFGNSPLDKKKIWKMTNQWTDYFVEM